MRVFPIFSVGLGVANMSEHLPLARKIFAENRHTLVEGDRTVTNFVKQNANKHVVKDNYTNPEDVDKLKLAIVRWGTEYLKKIGFHMDFYSYEVRNLWLNEYARSDACQFVHNHYGYMISGTYYVDTPEGSAPVVFTNPMYQFNAAFPADEIREYDVFNSDFWKVVPIEGEVVFWNSNLLHEVPEGSNKDPRRSISFDITVDKYIGSAYSSHK